MAKLKWRVAEAPTGPYRAFQRRGWPTATLGNDRTAFHILCADAYVPAFVREGKHGPLTIGVAVYNEKPVGFTWKYFKVKSDTLKEAKERCQSYVDRHPEIFKNADA